jgi:hypothetical protein
MLSDQELIDGLRAELADLHPPEDLLRHLQKQDADGTREELLATPAPAERRGWAALRQRGGVRRRPRIGLIAGATGMLAAVAVVVVLIFSATTSTPPAYALTTHPNGSITITLRDVATGIPAIQAKLHKVGYDVAVIPIKTNCHTVSGSAKIVMHPDPKYEFQGSVSMTYTPATVRRHPAPRVTHYVLSAKQLPNGKILAFIGAPVGRAPTCLSYNSTPSNSPSPTFVIPPSSSPPSNPGVTTTIPSP